MTKKNVDEKNRWVGSAVLWCRDKIRIIALKNRALYQYGVGGGGFVDKKRFRQPPLSFVDEGSVS